MEVKRYCVYGDWVYGKDRFGPVDKCPGDLHPEEPHYVYASEFDRILAERDALQSRLSAVEEDNDRIRTALEFYADKDHFAEDIRADWDSVSGEPSNFLWHDDEPWFVEDGSIARHALEQKS